jgi:F0F1-type ATP synthase epsilon subunit
MKFKNKPQISFMYFAPDPEKKIMYSVGIGFTEVSPSAVDVFVSNLVRLCNVPEKDILVVLTQITIPKLKKKKFARDNL